MTPVVDVALVHGGAQGAWVWEDTLAALRLQDVHGAVRVRAYDLPGCGAKRDRDPSGVTVRAAAGELAEEIAAAGQQNVLLVGHSFAGTVLPIVAELRRDLVARIAYVSCIAPPPDQSVGERMSRPHEGRSMWRADATVEEQWAHHRAAFCNDMAPAEADAFLAKLGADRFPTIATMAESGWRYDHLDGISAIYIGCLRDGILPVAWQEEFAERFRVAAHAWIDAGHQVMNTRPQALAELLLREAAALQHGQ